MPLLFKKAFPLANGVELPPAMGPVVSSQLFKPNGPVMLLSNSICAMAPAAPIAQHEAKPVRQSNLPANNTKPDPRMQAMPMALAPRQVSMTCPRMILDPYFITIMVTSMMVQAILTKAYEKIPRGEITLSG